MAKKTEYLQTLRTALWGKPIETPAISEEQMLMHMRQGTATLVFPSLTMTPQMKMVCLQNMQQQVKLQHVLSQAWSALTEAGIQPVLMKGAGLAALYPEPQMRAWGDIDLFVGKEQYHPACAVMRATFPEALKFDEELDHYKHYNLIADGISIEIHRVSVGFQHPIDERRYARIEHFGMTHAVPLTDNQSPIPLSVPEPTFNALFVMLHSWEHMTTMGANMRQLCDLTLLLHHYGDRIDRKRLECYLRQLHLMDVWQLYCCIMVEHLGLPKAEAPFYRWQVRKRAERLLEDLLENKMVAPKASDKAPKSRVLRKIHTMQERLRNARRIGQYSPAYARHMVAETMLHGARRFFAQDRHWE